MAYADNGDICYFISAYVNSERIDINNSCRSYRSPGYLFLTVDCKNFSYIILAWCGYSFSRRPDHIPVFIQPRQTDGRPADQIAGLFDVFNLCHDFLFLSYYIGPT